MADRPALQFRVHNQCESKKCDVTVGDQTDVAKRIEVDLSEELEEESELWVKHTLIARIIGLNWSRRKIKNRVETSWADRTVIKFLPKGFFVVLFEEESERERILRQENWFADGHAIYIQPWIPNFNPLPLAVYTNPI
ncbi:hypothetical protein SUGI_0774120 [Cryptomeria japonica]|nr:hypothetical protein SUGI_0774120 [Cryptomeria japonica]